MFVASPTHTSLLASSSVPSVPSVLRKARSLTKTTLLFAAILILTPDRQSSPVNSPFLDDVDAASSISPLFATLTKNTGGWGYLSFSTRLSELCASALGSLSSLTLSLFCAKSEKINPLFSNSSALFKKECFTNCPAINTFRTLFEKTRGGGYILQTKSLRRHFCAGNNGWRPA